MDEADTPIEAAWEHIENWLMENAPMTLLTLNGGATDKEFWAAEAALGFPLPDEIRESYRIHNGQPEGVLMNDAQFLPLAGMASAWQTYPNPRWLPLTTDEADNHICIDGKPATQSGTSAQIIFYQHDANFVQVVAENFTQWLTHFADALEAGEYVWSNDYDGLTPVHRDEMNR